MSLCFIEAKKHRRCLAILRGGLSPYIYASLSSNACCSLMIVLGSPTPGKLVHTSGIYIACQVESLCLARNEEQTGEAARAALEAGARPPKQATGQGGCL